MRPIQYTLSSLVIHQKGSLTLHDLLSITTILDYLSSWEDFGEYIRLCKS